MPISLPKNFSVSHYKTSIVLHFSLTLEDILASFIFPPEGLQRQLARLPFCAIFYTLNYSANHRPSPSYANGNQQQEEARLA